MKTLSVILVSLALISCSPAESLDANLSSIAVSYVKEKKYASDKALHYEKCYINAVREKMTSNALSEEEVTRVSADFAKNMATEEVSESEKERFWKADETSPEGILMGEMIGCAMKFN
jgi:hypothetical protein